MSIVRVIFGSLVLPVAIVVVGIQGSYWSNSVAPSTVLGYLLLVVAFAVGLWSVSRLPYRSKRAKVASAAIYTLVILPVLVYSSFWTACRNGGCL